MRGVYIQKKSPFYWLRYYDKSEPVQSRRSKSICLKIEITPADRKEQARAHAEKRRAKLTGTKKLQILVSQIRDEITVRNIELQTGIVIKTTPDFSTAFSQLIKARTLPGTEEYLKPRTVTLYQSTADLFLQACNNAPVDKYSTEINNQLVRHMQTAGLKPSSMSIHTRTLKAIFNWFIKQKYINTNPVKTVKYLDTAPVLISGEHMQIILNHFKIKEEQYQYIFLKFLQLTGCRPSSAVVQQLSNIDLDNNILHIQNVKTGHLKAAATYPFPITEELNNILAPYINALPKGAVRLFPQFKVSDHYTQSLRFWDRAMKKLTTPAEPGTKAVLPRKYSFKHFRSTFASNQAKKGNTNPFELQRLLDHSSIATTKKHYITIEMQQLKKKLEEKPKAEKKKKK